LANPQKDAYCDRVRVAVKDGTSMVDGTATIDDVLIAGGGQVGLGLALALRRSAPDMAVTLVDATPPGAGRSGRASTITAGGRKMLERLGVWERIQPAAQPVNSMIITDSRTRDVARPVFLTFAMAGDDGVPTAHVIPDELVVEALRLAAGEAGVALIAADAVKDFEVTPARVTATTRQGRALAARLLVAADGARSRLRELAGITTFGWSYGQSGIVATVEHERDHGGVAEEHFLPGGPFAILPLRDKQASLVWTEPTDVAERLVHGDPFVFAVELERRFGHHLGAMRVIDTPQAFPLGLSLARSFVKPRLALTGDAAHRVHPIAGQGVNLGYRDVAALAETLVEAHRLGLDIGTTSVLERYQSWRRFDTLEMGLATDGLNRLFSNDNPALRLVRDVGLGLVDRLPSLKQWFVREASGAAHGAPKLLTGEAI
jgi:2-octaprenyl-6-methoxyphenol hydroxylase